MRINTENKDRYICPLPSGYAWCQTDKCMGWRSIYRREARLDSDHFKTNEGYCGLVGKPLLTAKEK